MTTRILAAGIIAALSTTHAAAAADIEAELDAGAANRNLAGQAHAPLARDESAVSHGKPEESGNPVGIGMELGGDTLRIAVFENGRARDVAFDNGHGRVIAEKFKAGHTISSEDAGFIKAALESAGAANCFKNVVLALPRDIPFDARRSINEAFSGNGMNIRRVIDRTTAFAFAFQNANPSMDETLSFVDCGDGTQEVSVVDIGDDVCLVKEVGTTEGIRPDPDTREIRIPTGDYGVVHGAALYAGVLARELRDGLVIDVVGHDIGILQGDGFVYPILGKDVTIPTSRKCTIEAKRQGDVFIGTFNDERYFTKLAGPFSWATPNFEQTVEIDVGVERDVTICAAFAKEGEPYGTNYVKFREGLVESAAIAESQRKLDAWCEAVVASSKAAPANSANEDSDVPAKSIWAKKAAVCAVIGGVIGAIKGLFGRKGQENHENR